MTQGRGGRQYVPKVRVRRAVATSANGGVRQPSSQAFDGAQLSSRGTTRADEVRVVGIREAICSGAGRAHDDTLFEGENGVPRPGRGEDVRDRIRSFGIGNRVAASIKCCEGGPFPLGDLGQERCARRGSRPDLEGRRGRAPPRPGGWSGGPSRFVSTPASCSTWSAWPSPSM